MSAVKVLINGKSRYIGDNLAKWISNQKPGACLDNAGEEEEGQQAENSQQASNFDVTCISHQQTKAEIEEIAMNSDVIIWQITDFSDNSCVTSDISDGEWLVDSLSKNCDSFSTAKQFILISTVATWARTKPSDDPDLGFDENNFRTRRSHNNFKEHLNLEKAVIKAGKINKQKLSCFVIASGVQYGLGESCFHYAFKQPWLEVAKEVKIYGSGKNKIPTIHINDLGQIVCNVIDHKPAQKYIVAVDSAVNTYSQIVRTVAANIGQGQTCRVKDFSELYTCEEDVTPRMADLLLIDLFFEQGESLKETFDISWHKESGLVDNIDEIVGEFRVARKLLPIRFGIYGPPQVGKSALARKFANEYKLHVITAENLIPHTTELLQTIISHSEAKANEAIEDEDEEEDEGDLSGDIDVARDLLNDIQEGLSVSARLDDELMCKIFRYHLTSKPCKNQGFVLDGFPKTKEQAAILFALDDDAEEGEDGELPVVPFLPELVVGLEASDDWLKQRVMNLSEDSIQGTHNDEEGFLRRLTQFRDNNVEDLSPMTFFDENEVHPKLYNLDGTIDPATIDENYGKEIPHPCDEPNDGSFSAILKHIREIIGAPRNYGPSIQELAEINAMNEVKAKEAAEIAAAEEKAAKEQEDASRKARMEEWEERLAEVQRQESEAYEAASQPLRNYLMKFVMPTLVKGMHECTKVRPDDPVDFIAEYLFKNNPQYD